ncbi:MAG: helix-turn-helix domain-containing protein [Kiritimatiellae bacterium]|nr:helix-turn-helix domain-containing protein [Kiritimatiellia bacterium]
MRIDWDRYRARLFSLGRSHWTRGEVWGHCLGPPGQEFLRSTLHVFWGGSGRMHCRQGWVPLRAGICIWLRPGWRYTATQDPDNPIRMYFFGFDLLDAKDQLRPWEESWPPEFIEAPDPEVVEAMTRRVVEMCYGFGRRGEARAPYPDTMSRLAHSLFASVLMDLDAATDPSDIRYPQTIRPHHEKMVRQAILLFSETPNETLSVAQIARRLSYSPSRFAHIFKLVTGQSPELFAIHMRLDNAKRMLKDTNLTVKEIAFAVGYRDANFFSRQFRQFVKRSPMQYRLSATGQS